MSSRNNNSIFDPVNIKQEINKMIPVRGPTIFEKQFTDFVHGKESKSGGNIMMKKL